jgi:hypothetical protein
LPTTFQRHVNDVLRNFIGIFVIVYLDDILVYSNSEEEHVDHVRQVLEVLRQHDLYAKVEKCNFHVATVEYLGFIISPTGVSMDPKKVQGVLEWAPPKTVKGVRGFLGFANFYRRFILGFSRIVSPIYNLLKKDAPFIWTPECQAAFEQLKERFTTGPILRHFNPESPTIMETDASDFAIAGVLLQVNPDNGLTHPVAYISRTLNSAERNYDVHDKEMLAIVFACIEWRPLLLSLSSTFTILSDHKSLEYFMTTKILNRRQARWAERLADFNFTLTYRPGVLNTSADALSRRDDAKDLSGGTSSAQTSFFQKSHLRQSSLKTYHPDTLLEQIRSAQKDDKELENILTNNERDPSYTIVDNVLLHQGRIVVPDKGDLRLQILQSRHDHTTAGHPGIFKTIEIVRRDFTWPGLRQYHPRLRTKLHHVHKEQNHTTQEIWRTPTPTYSRTTLVLNLYGLYRPTT